MRRPTAQALATLLAAALGATAAVACVRAAMGRLGKVRGEASPGTDAGNTPTPGTDAGDTPTPGTDTGDADGADDTAPKADPGHDAPTTQKDAGPDGADDTDEDSYDELMSAVAHTPDPIGALRATVDDIRRREAPTTAELTLARWLEEAGLMADGVDMPHLALVRLGRTKLYYLGMLDKSVSVAALGKILAIEAAINRMRHADMLLDDLADASERDIYRCTHALTQDICAQAPHVTSEALASLVAENDEQDGEWALRARLAAQIEGWHLPHRLEARYRCDAAAGRVAIEFKVTPTAAFPKSEWSDELGRVVRLSREMRRREAADYALRVGLLLATGAFCSSGRVSRVCVAGVRDDATGHRCLLSAEFDRRRFCSLDLGDMRWPVQAYTALGASVSMGDDGGLAPVEQTWSLDDERFCPSERQQAVELSLRPLSPGHAQALGCDTAMGMGIDTMAGLADFARNAARLCGGSCESLVSGLLALARQTEDPDCATAARRCARLLVSGDIDPDDGLAVEQELMYGNGAVRILSQGIREAADKHVEQAINHMLEVTDMLKPHKIPSVTWHAFRTYAERLVYNRLLAVDGEDLRLAPATLTEAHLGLSLLLPSVDRKDDADDHARQAAALSPMDERACLRVVRAIEDSGDLELAAAEARDFLRIAHTPEAIGVTYYRLAYLRWQLGDTFAAEACYRASINWPSTVTAHALIELHTLLAACGPQLSDLPVEKGVAFVPDNSPTAKNSKVAGPPRADDPVGEALRSCDIPVAPTSDVLEALAEGARAAADEGMFPVARALTLALAGLTRDDAVYDIANSLEGAPDRL